MLLPLHCRRSNWEFSFQDISPEPENLLQNARMDPRAIVGAVPWPVIGLMAHESKATNAAMHACMHCRRLACASGGGEGRPHTQHGQERIKVLLPPASHYCPWLCCALPKCTIIFTSISEQNQLQEKKQIPHYAAT